MEVKGILHLTWKKGVPCFIFVVHFETGREIYTATLKKIARTLDSTYLFYSCNSQEQSFIGQMKITSTCSYNPDRSRLTETRFVLFGSNESEQLRSKKGLFRSKSRVRNEMKCLTELPENRNLELAAVIVRRWEELAGGGWGLKFLRSPVADESREKSSPEIVVVYAAGPHGGPVVGPASLTERWKCGGSCDCGGWDLGCPIKILSMKDRDNKEGILELFTQGREGEREPEMKVEEMKDGIFRVSIREGISALQTFSTAVALIHVRTARWPCTENTQ